MAIAFSPATTLRQAAVRSEYLAKSTVFAASCARELLLCSSSCSASPVDGIEAGKQWCKHISTKMLPDKTTVYDSVNPPVLSRVPKSTKRLLDVGCGAGALGRQIKQTINCEVVGVTYSEAEVALASQWLDQVFLGDLNCFDTEELGRFDCIICSHVLEHLCYPQKLLTQLSNNLTPDGMLIVALPNVLHWKQRLEFLRGRFKYTDSGLMDRTHFRFFDWETARELLEQSGYTIIDSIADGYFPLPGVRKLIAPAVSLWVDNKAVKLFPGLFGLQFVFTCRSKSLSGGSPQ